MMRAIRRKPKQSSLLHQKIRKAAFVPLKPEKNERLKYRLSLLGSENAKRKLRQFKALFVKITQVTDLLLKKIDWVKIRNDATAWMVEAIIEGAGANFVTHYLLGWPFTVPTMLAHGFAIKQGLSIIRRIRQNGTNNSIPKKDQ